MALATGDCDEPGYRLAYSWKPLCHFHRVHYDDEAYAAAARAKML